ncbi:hypothetical protein EXIGLDRAFT_843616 [Exidia glandulosa HHB12029]|uniref:Uncharacterized protein n=1 Tax=Exidia glandulosa HHB12029 TaxID=1314781 RepID=A0A165CIP4_EXIGL|nr:hypothetical protein EXIGLDRAFT_843616 [Exidia glandulosa HHB12029]
MSDAQQITTTQAEINAFVAHTRANVEELAKQAINEREQYYVARDAEQARKFEEHLAQQQAAFDAERLQWEQRMEAATAMRVQHMQDTIRQMQAQMQNAPPPLPDGQPAAGGPPAHGNEQSPPDPVPDAGTRIPPRDPVPPIRRRKTTRVRGQTIGPYQLTKKMLPKGGAGTKKALEVHISALSGRVAARAVIKPPTEAERAFHRQHYDRSSDTAEPLIPLDLVKIARKYAGMQKDGVTAAHVNRIHDTVFGEMQKQCAKYAIVRWAIDPYEAVDSEWNTVMRDIALSAFRYALLAHRYDYLHADHTFANPMRAGDLEKLYLHVVHHKQAGRTLGEETNAGSVTRREGKAVLYRGRGRVSDRRLQIALDRGDPERLIQLVECKRAHSETRKNPETGRDERCAMPHRSEAVQSYFEDLDRHDATIAGYSGRPAPPAREKVSNPPAGQCNALPKTAPLDFFKPDFFNGLPLHLRRGLTAKGVWIAMPDNVPFDVKARALKYDDEKFMRKVGNTILARYNLDSENGNDDVDMDDFLSSDEEGESSGNGDEGGAD